MSTKGAEAPRVHLVDAASVTSKQNPSAIHVERGPIGIPCATFIHRDHPSLSTFEHGNLAPKFLPFTAGGLRVLTAMGAYVLSVLNMLARFAIDAIRMDTSDRMF